MFLREDKQIALSSFRQRTQGKADCSPFYRRREDRRPRYAGKRGEKEATKKGYTIRSAGLAAVLKDRFEECEEKTDATDYLQEVMVQTGATLDHLEDMLDLSVKDLDELGAGKEERLTKSMMNGPGVPPETMGRRSISDELSTGSSNRLFTMTSPL